MYVCGRIETNFITACTCFSVPCGSLIDTESGDPQAVQLLRDKYKADRKVKVRAVGFSINHGKIGYPKA